MFVRETSVFLKTTNNLTLERKSVTVTNFNVEKVKSTPSSPQKIIGTDVAAEPSESVSSDEGSNFEIPLKSGTPSIEPIDEQEAKQLVTDR